MHSNPETPKATPKLMDIRELETHAGYIRQQLRRAAQGMFKLQPAEIDDLVQATYEKAWQNQGTYEPTKGLLSWMRTIMYNTYVDLHRQRVDRLGKEGVLIEKVTGDLESAEHHQTPDVRVDASVLKNKVNEALDKLPERQATALRMFSDGWSQKQIAEHFKISEDGAESLIARARRALKQSPDIQTLRNELE